MELRQGLGQSRVPTAVHNMRPAGLEFNGYLLNSLIYQ